MHPLLAGRVHELHALLPSCSARSRATSSRRELTAAAAEVGVDDGVAHLAHDGVGGRVSHGGHASSPAPPIPPPGSRGSVPTYGAEGVNREGPSAVLDFSPIQILIVLVIALIVFGPKRLPGDGPEHRPRHPGVQGRDPRRRVHRPARGPRAGPPGGRRADGGPRGRHGRRGDPEDDDILEGIVVPGDTPPAPDAPPAPPRAPDA